MSEMKKEATIKDYVSRNSSFKTQKAIPDGAR